MFKFLPGKPKASILKKIKVLSLSLLFVVISLVVLLSTPKAIKLTESKVFSSQNQSQQLGQLLMDAPVEKKVEAEIVDSNIPPPDFSAEAILVFDVISGKILYQKNIHERLSPASTTKIMTALVSQDVYKSADILTVTPQSLVGGSSMGLVDGERLTYRSLLYGMLLNSGNDAAYTIAVNYPGGFEQFVAAMNQKVAQLNLKDTNFTNPAGFDNKDHYSSAYDLSQIAKELISSPQLSKIVSTKETSIISLDKTHQHPLKNVNKLLSEDGVIGIKTGYTLESGENLVGLVERNNHEVITVILHSQDRFGESKKLMDWVFENFVWK